MNDDIIIQNIYIKKLKEFHIHLVDRDDYLVWSINKSCGCYSPKLGYRVLRQEYNHPKGHWWIPVIWKLNYPLKIKFFMWLVSIRTFFSGRL